MCRPALTILPQFRPLIEPSRKQDGYGHTLQTTAQRWRQRCGQQRQHRFSRQEPLFLLVSRVYNELKYCAESIFSKTVAGGEHTNILLPELYGLTVFRRVSLGDRPATSLKTIKVPVSNRLSRTPCRVHIGRFLRYRQRLVHGASVSGPNQPRREYAC